MDYFQAAVLGVVEGLTEFLPVSSTGHLTIAEQLLGLDVDDRELTAYTALIQIGAIAAVLVYFRGDIWRIARAWAHGLWHPEVRGQLDHRMGWYVILGSLPIGVVGLLAEPLVTGGLRSLWVVAAGLILWSAVMLYAERQGTQRRSEKDLTLRDALGVGLVQCVALVPGVSRSGATISMGLLLGVDRVTATRLSFFLSIPALVGAGLFELPTAVGGSIGVGQAVVGIAVSFVVAYASVAWLLQFVAGHSIGSFVPYRVVLGGVLLVALGAGWIVPD